MGVEASVGRHGDWCQAEVADVSGQNRGAHGVGCRGDESVRQSQGHPSTSGLGTPFPREKRSVRTGLNELDRPDEAEETVHGDRGNAGSDLANHNLSQQRLIA